MNKRHQGGSNKRESCADLYPRTKKLAYEISFTLNELESNYGSTDEGHHRVTGDLVRLYDNLQRVDIAVKQEIKIGSYGSAVLLTCGNNITHTHIRYKSFKINGVVWHRSITKDNNFLITGIPAKSRRDRELIRR